MFTLTSNTLTRAAIMVALTFATPVTAILMSAAPAAAECKYGGPHCVNPNPLPKLPKVGGAQIPGSGWVDPDCKYFGNCNSSEVKGTEFRRKPTTPVAALPGTTRLSNK